jgi:hypothetical protein
MMRYFEFEDLYRYVYVFVTIRNVMWYVLKLKSIEDRRLFVNSLHMEYDVIFWVWVWICIGMFMYLLQSEMWCDMFLNWNRSKIVCEFVTHRIVLNWNRSKIVCEFVTHRTWCDLLSLSLDLYRHVYVFVTIRNVMS